MKHVIRQLYIFFFFIRINIFSETFISQRSEKNVVLVFFLLWTELIINGSWNIAFTNPVIDYPYFVWQVTFISKLSISHLLFIHGFFFERSWCYFKYWILVKSKDSQNTLSHWSNSMTWNRNVSYNNSTNTSSSIICPILLPVWHLFAIWFVVLQIPHDFTSLVLYGRFYFLEMLYFART